MWTAKCSRRPGYKQCTLLTTVVLLILMKPNMADTKWTLHSTIPPLSFCQCMTLLTMLTWIRICSFKLLFAAMTPILCCLWIRVWHHLILTILQHWPMTWSEVGVLKTLPTLLTTHHIQVSVGLHLMHSPLLTATHQSTCSVSWWCAGMETILPAATKAVWAGSGGVQDLPREKWVLSSDLFNFRRLPLRRGVPSWPPTPRWEGSLRAPCLLPAPIFLWLWPSLCWQLPSSQWEGFFWSANCKNRSPTRLCERWLRVCRWRVQFGCFRAF